MDESAEYRAEAPPSDHEEPPPEDDLGEPWRAQAPDNNIDADDIRF